jgi:hypothetical protein
MMMNWNQYFIVGHADGQGNGTARAMGNIEADEFAELGQIDDGHVELRKNGRRGVDGEVVIGDQRHGRQQGHQGYKAFRQHGAVAHHGDLTLFLDQFGRRAGADQGMEPGDGAAGDGDENIGPPGTGDYGAAAVDELAREGHLHHGVHEEQTDPEGHDDTDLHVGAEVIPGRQEQPDGQCRRAEPVKGQHDREGLLVVGEPARNAGLGDGGAQEHGRADRDDTDDGPGEDGAGSDLEHVDADGHGDGDRHGNREDAPGVVVEGVHNRYGKTRKGHDDDKEDDEGRRQARDLAHVLLGDD